MPFDQKWPKEKCENALYSRAFVRSPASMLRINLNGACAAIAHLNGKHRSTNSRITWPPAASHGTADATLLLLPCSNKLPDHWLLVGLGTRPPGRVRKLSWLNLLKSEWVDERRRSYPTRRVLSLAQCRLATQAGQCIQSFWLGLWPPNSLVT